MQDIKQLIQTPVYNFLRENKHLGKNMMLLALSGSHAHGIAMDYSNINLLGCAINTASDILGMSTFECYKDRQTDTVINSFFKTAALLVAGDISTSEMLGCEPEHYTLVSPLGQQLLSQKQLFFSQALCASYTGYIHACMEYLSIIRERMHLKNQCSEKQIIASAEPTLQKFYRRYAADTQQAIRLYIKPSDRQGYDVETHMDIHIQECPLRDFYPMLNALTNIVQSQETAAKLRRSTDKHTIGKKMATLVRMLYTCCEYLETGNLKTYRSEEQQQLLQIRNGAFLTPQLNILPEFDDLLQPLLKRLEYAGTHTELPKKPDSEQINEFVMDISRKAIRRKPAASAANNKEKVLV